MARPVSKVFYFTDYVLIIYQVINRQVNEERRFILNAEGQASFANWLLDSGIQPLSMPVAIVVESRLEEYQLDTIPHVRGRNRTELLNHRLRRLYTVPYTYAKVLGRVTSSPVSGKRVDDRVLFSALGNAEMFLPWIRLLLTQRISIRGIYSLPLLSQQPLKELELPDNILLVTHTEQVAASVPQGLRQSFFHKGHLFASRLTPLPIPSPEPGESDYAAYVCNEILKTQQYLGGHVLLNPDQVLTVLLIGKPEDLVQIQQKVTENPQPGLQFRFHALDDFLRQGGLRHTKSAAFFHFLPIQQVARGTIPNHYAQTGERFYDIHLQLQQRLYNASQIIFVLALLTSSLFAYWGWQTQQDNAVLEAKIQRLQDEYKQTQDKLGTHIEPRHMRNAVEAAEQLRENRLSPEQALALIGAELQNFPALKLRTIKWSINEVVDAIEARGAGSSAFLAKAIEARRKAGKLHTNFEQIIELEGQVWSLRNNLPQAQRTFDSFVQHLRRLPNIRLEVQEQPVNPYKLGEAFRSSLSKDKQNNQADAGFKLDIRVMPEPTNLPSRDTSP